MWQSLALISAGASVGACARWGLGLWLNPLFASFTFGTLIANALGCLLMGLLLGLSWQLPQFSDSYRLFFITGFLGSLTTFSALSAEVMEKILSQDWRQALLILLLHMVLGLGLTLLGIKLVS